ncbi:MAG TPA: cytochrome c-type biogenesis CcmF C-terminal domain-containing protein [Bacillota bacterium]
MIIAWAGQAALWFVLGTMAAAAGSIFFGLARQRAAAQRLGIAAARAAFVAATAALLLLAGALLADRFELVYVANNSRRLMAWPYKIGAVWAGQAGSLLLWLWMLTLAALLVSREGRPDGAGRPGLAMPALGVIAAIGTFFALLVTVVENPFALQFPAPADGRGMNPLLQNPSMLVHPLLTYLGFVGFSVPYAFAVAALLTRRTDAAWLRRTRWWTLTSWLLLSTGILIGGQWAYVELGWGGYWAWDPVENSSLLPWLTATAFLHSAMVEERRGMLRVWNRFLIMGTFLLTLLGTFLTRSGIIASVHAFAQSPIGPWFIGFLGLVGAVSAYLLLDRLAELRREPEFESPLSREVGFLFNNLLLLAAALAVLWGTLFPLISRLRGAEVTVGAPFFNRVAGPLLLGVIGLMGVGPLLAWRRSDPQWVGRSLLPPALAALAGAQILILAGVRRPAVLLGLALLIFVAALTLAEIGRGVLTRARAAGEPLLWALTRAFRANPRRYGGYVVHLGVLVLAAGVIASTSYTTEVQAPLRLGESVAVGPYRVRYLGVEHVEERGVPTIYANLEVRRGQDLVAYLRPAKTMHPGFVATMGPTTEVAVLGGFTRDLYAVLAGVDDAGTTAGFELMSKPLVSWIWLGGYLILAGTAFSLWPRPRRAFSPAVEPLLQELSDLEAEHRAGKVDEDTYRPRRRELAGALEARLERDRELEAAFEAEVRRLLEEAP